MEPVDPAAMIGAVGLSLRSRFASAPIRALLRCAGSLAWRSARIRGQF
jgi:hypothetical protein